MTITVYDPGLAGGSKAETYTVLSGDTLTSIASGLAGVISADSTLSALGITATSVSTVVNITSQSLNATTYAQSTSVGATETITLGTGTAATQYAYNNVNELTSLAAGGAVKYEGYTNKPVKSATVNGNPATLNYAENFTGNATLSSGNNTTTASATDGSNNTVTQTQQVSTKGPSNASLTYDANGNMTSDGTNTYAWDAENRLIQITYPGSSNNSQFTYDGLGHCVDIVETSGGTVTSTKQFVWSGSHMCEARNAGGSVTGQYFLLGETISGTNYYYALDYLSSVREMTNASGTIESQYSYDPYGQATKISGSGPSSDFQYAGYYYHVASSLNLTLNRVYNPGLGRWITRDPIEQEFDINLYAYVNSNPLEFVDPSGLDKCPPAQPPSHPDAKPKSPPPPAPPKPKPSWPWPLKPLPPQWPFVKNPLGPTWPNGMPKWIPTNWPTPSMFPPPWPPVRSIFDWDPYAIPPGYPGNPPLPPIPPGEPYNYFPRGPIWYRDPAPGVV